MNKGFTLIEVVIAAALLAISLSMFLGSFVMSKKSAVIASMRMKSLHKAREEMEIIMSKPYNDASLSMGNHTISNGYYTVSQNAVYNDAKDIEVTLYWINPTASITSSVTVSSSMSEALH